MGRKRQHASATDRYRAAYLRRKARFAAGEHKTLALNLSADQLNLFMALKDSGGFARNGEAFAAMLKVYAEHVNRPKAAVVETAAEASAPRTSQTGSRPAARKKKAKTEVDHVDLDQLGLFD